MLAFIVAALTISSSPGANCGSVAEDAKGLAKPDEITFEDFLARLQKAERRFSRVEFVSEEDYQTLGTPLFDDRTIMKARTTIQHIYQDEWFRVHRYDAHETAGGESKSTDLLYAYDGDHTRILMSGKVANITGVGLEKELAEHCRDPLGRAGLRLYPDFKGVVEEDGQKLFLLCISTYDPQDPKPLGAVDENLSPQARAFGANMYVRRNIYFDTTEDLWPVKRETAFVEGDLGGPEWLTQRGFVSEWQYVDGQRLPATLVHETYRRVDDPNASERQAIQTRRVIKFTDFNLSPDYEVSKFRFEFPEDTLVYVRDTEGKIVREYIEGSPRKAGEGTETGDSESNSPVK
jgi:hypothetical protein